MKTIVNDISPKPVLRPLVFTVLLLMVPLLAMQFTDEVIWTGSDFAVAGGLLLTAGFAYELAAFKAPNRLYRSVAALSIAAVLGTVWVILAT